MAISKKEKINAKDDTAYGDDYNYLFIHATIISRWYNVSRIISLTTTNMLTTIAVILLVLWVLGFIGFHVLGSFIHILLVIAVVMFLIRIIRGKNPLA